MGGCDSVNNKFEKSNQNYTSKENKGVNEVDTKHAATIPESVTDRLFNSIFRIEMENIKGTGFFIEIKEIKGFFMFTNYHLINQTLVDSKALIPVYYGKKDNEIKKVIKLDKDERFIKCFDESIDITVIEILKEDEIPKL